MSRAKKYNYNGGHVWFDYKSVATVEQLELLSDLTGESIDDVLDAGLSQKEVARRLFAMDGLIPEYVLENRRKRIEAMKHAPACRWCESYGGPCEGSITRHHYVPRWLMLLLENYSAYAPRTFCTIPICLGRHRDLHLRGGSPKSIADLLADHERRFAQKMLDELRDQRPRVYDLIGAGDENSYEAQLVRDHQTGAFRTAVVASQEVTIPVRQLATLSA